MSGDEDLAAEEVVTVDHVKRALGATGQFERRRLGIQFAANDQVRKFVAASVDLMLVAVNGYGFHGQPNPKCHGTMPHTQ